MQYLIVFLEGIITFISPLPAADASNLRLLFCWQRG